MLWELAHVEHADASGSGEPLQTVQRQDCELAGGGAGSGMRDCEGSMISTGAQTSVSMGPSTAHSPYVTAAAAALQQCLCHRTSVQGEHRFSMRST